MDRGYLRSGVYVADIGGDAGSSGDIVKGEARNEGIELHEKGERLPDPAGGAENGYLALRHRLGGVPTAEEMRGAAGGGGVERSEHRWLHHFLSHFGFCFNSCNFLRKNEREKGTTMALA